MLTIAVDAMGSEGVPGEIVRAGTSILGFDRLVIKADSLSRAHAIKNVVKGAAKAAREQIPEEIAAGLSSAAQ